MKAALNWQGGFKFFSYDDQHHQTVFDADPEGGPTAGPVPMNLFLQSLTACGAMDIVFILNKRRLKIDKFNIEVETERADEHPKIFTVIKIKYIISGEGINEREMDRAISLSEDKFCSILAMIDKSKTKVDFEYEIV